MRLNLLYENDDKFRKAILAFLSRLPYKLVAHSWEDGTESSYYGYFLLLGQQLETYKLKESDLIKSNAYLLGHFFNPDKDWDDDNAIHTEEIPAEEFVDELDDVDLPVIAERLYDILDTKALGKTDKADRWFHYRLDTKQHKPLLKWPDVHGMLLRDLLDDDPTLAADWWKNDDDKIDNSDQV